MGTRVVRVAVNGYGVIGKRVADAVSLSLDAIRRAPPTPPLAFFVYLAKEGCQRRLRPISHSRHTLCRGLARARPEVRSRIEPRSALRLRERQGSTTRL